VTRVRRVTHTAAGELAEIARVARQLVLTYEDRESPDAWIPGLPLDFSGHVTLDKPHYLVEVQAITEHDSDDVDKNCFLVSIDTDITVAAREVRYEYAALQLVCVTALCLCVYVSNSACYLTSVTT